MRPSGNVVAGRDLGRRCGGFRALRHVHGAAACIGDDYPAPSSLAREQFCLEPLSGVSGEVGALDRNPEVERFDPLQPQPIRPLVGPGARRRPGQGIAIV